MHAIFLLPFIYNELPYDLFTNQTQQGSKENNTKQSTCPHPNQNFWEVLKKKCNLWDFPGGTVVKNLPANAGTQV